MMAFRQRSPGDTVPGHQAALTQRQCYRMGVASNRDRRLSACEPTTLPLHSLP